MRGSGTLLAADENEEMKGATIGAMAFVMTACMGPSGPPASGPTPSTAAAEPDGALDCPTNVTFTSQASVSADAVGEATPEAGLRVFLERWATWAGGEVVIVSETRGSLVADGREIGIADATPAPAGGWLVLTSSGCEGTPPP